MKAVLCRFFLFLDFCEHWKIGTRNGSSEEEVEEGEEEENCTNEHFLQKAKSHREYG